MIEFFDPIARLLANIEPLGKWIVMGYFAERITLLIIRELREWREQDRRSTRER